MFLVRFKSWRCIINEWRSKPNQPLIRRVFVQSLRANRSVTWCIVTSIYVHSIASRVLRNGILAEDVTQHAFLALAQHAAKLQNRCSIAGWLHETTLNLAINTVRRREATS
jgi:hypothetical protein